jgi:hypothetical protein
VYAVSTNGFWNDGDSYILARVPRSRLADLNAAEWTYFRGGDGMSAGNWSRNIDDATPLLELRTHCGQSGPCYIPALGLYVMIAWYNTEKMTKWYEPNEMRYDFYQAPQPWGPWSMVRSYSDRFLAAGQHMYGPSLCAKFQRKEGTDVHATMFTSGCPFEDIPGGMYKAWSIPVILRTAPAPPSREVPAGDPSIVYKGSWAGSGGVRESRAAGDSAELRFDGVGVDYVADKFAGFGTADVFLDGDLAHTAPLGTKNLPRLSDVTVYRSGALKPGPHTIRVANKSGAPVVVRALRIYS